MSDPSVEGRSQVRWGVRWALVPVVPALAAATVVLGAGTARADEPAVQGWWTATNPGDVAPANPASVSDVPADGLLLQAGPSGPTAYAALDYFLDPGSTADVLTLTVAPNTVSTPGGTIDLCPLKAAGFSPSQAGPLASAPAYDCAKKVVATASADGTTYTARVGALQQADSLSVALVPGSTTARVVLAKPGATSLSTTSGQASTPTSSAAGGGADPGGTVEPGGSGVSGRPGLGAGDPVLPSTAVPSLPGTEPQGPVVAPGDVSVPVAPDTAALPVASAAAAADDGDASPRWALGLLLGVGAVGAVLWAHAGTSGGRAPRIATEHEDRAGSSPA